MKKVKKPETSGAAGATGAAGDTKVSRQPRLAAHRERAAKALRDNLQKRKAQARARGTDAAVNEPTDPKGRE